MKEREWEYYIPRKHCTIKSIEEPHSASSTWQRQPLAVKEEVLVIVDAASPY